MSTRCTWTSAGMRAPLPVTLRLVLGGTEAEVEVLAVPSLDGGKIGVSFAVAARMWAAG